MSQIYYGDELVDQLGINRSGQRSKQPFTSWFVEPVTIAGRAYYLHIEELTALPILTDDIREGHRNFSSVVWRVINSMGNLVGKQREKLNFHTETNRYFYDNKARSLKMANYKNIIKNHQRELNEILKTDGNVSVNRQLADASLNLLLLTGDKEETQVLTAVAKICNQLFPIKTHRPKKGAKYQTLEPRFADPRQWAAKDLTDPQIQAKIQQNNRQMVTQFVSVIDVQNRSQSDIEQLLLEYLNNYLFKNDSYLVTANLADVNGFFWQKLNENSDVLALEDNLDFIGDCLAKFYQFLSQTGIILQSEAQRLPGYFDEALTVATGDDPSDYYDDSIEQFLIKNPDLVENFLQDLVTTGELPNNLEKLIADGTSKNYYDLHRDQQTYEITAKLRDFKPSTRRRFKIAGGVSLAKLQFALIIMFNGQFEHLSSLYFPKTKERFELAEDITDDGFMFEQPIEAEKARISYLKPNDHLVFTYDFGDNWEFDIRVKQILDEPAPQHPEIIAGKGYGIIEDIGGVWGLENYYEDYQKGQLDPEFVEWLGRKIDLDSFDKEAINDELKSFDGWLEG